jgi:hypothetical protein
MTNVLFMILQDCFISELVRKIGHVYTSLRKTCGGKEMSVNQNACTINSSIGRLVAPWHNIV